MSHTEGRMSLGTSGMTGFWKTGGGKCVWSTQHTPRTWHVFRKWTFLSLAYPPDPNTYPTGHTNSSCATAQPTTTCNTLSSCPPRRTNAEQGQELGDHAGPSAPLPRSSANAAAGGKPECSPDARCCVAGRQTWFGNRNAVTALLRLYKPLVSHTHSFYHIVTIRKWQLLIATGSQATSGTSDSSDLRSSNSKAYSRIKAKWWETAGWLFIFL